MKYLIIFLFLIFFSSHLFFVFSLLPIRIMMLRSKKKNNLERITIEEKYEQINKTKVTAYLKNYISSLMNGYIRYFIIKLGMIPSHTIRNFIYRKVLLIDMAKNSILYYGAEIRAPYNLKIGKGSIIGDKSILDARNGIEVGENVNFSSNVHIWTEQHDHRDPYFACNSDHSFKVIIGDRAWIGPNVTILPKIKIGEGAIIAAGSVVTKNVEPFTIVAGMPAKKIGDRNRDLRYIFDKTPSPFY